VYADHALFYNSIIYIQYLFSNIIIILVLLVMLFDRFRIRRLLSLGNATDIFRVSSCMPRNRAVCSGHDMDLALIMNPSAVNVVRTNVV